MINIPDLSTDGSNFWVILSLPSGKIVGEAWFRSNVESLDPKRYKLVTSKQYYK